MPTSPGPSTGRAPRTRGLWRTGALAGAVTLALTTSLGAVPAAADELPGIGEVVMSDNITHVANVPKPAPFDTQAAYNTDLAFTGDYVIDGNYNGFVIYDISDPTEPGIVSKVLCEGGQGDISVSGDLLYFSVDYPRADENCGSPASNAGNADAFEGIRIFDISDKSAPQYVAAVRTDCGSHTHTLVPGEDGKTDYLYVSSYAPSANFPNCQPPHDKIAIIEVPLDDPASAAIVNEPVLFPDGGNHDQPGLSRPTQGCHDITVYPERDIAAGACMGDGILMDISDPVEPVVVERVQDENFAFWHSATFSNDGKKVIFTDELGGGGAATCTDQTAPEHGANAIFTLKGRIGPGANDPELNFAGYYKIPRLQGANENCVAHNGSLIPVQGKDYFVQSWYQGGVSIIDFNNPARAREIGYFDRGPLSEQLSMGGSWSAYYYNGYIYSSDIQKGLDVLKVEDRRLKQAEKVEYTEFNPQTQPHYKPGRG
ncbi:LVIVD repeat-containing protein [Marinactinospora thermotolerans]|uniref:Uncharacterized conserved protein n=1 Tax=Marinactinospora thermotolerans DSM 45154 TaxID=1122192 RepID=A0A1T4SNW3_9ACTN|nr:hypothetical protein [Marinactinospora thermotolerans]SKA29994.1 Uncharacterized conserved protein [Marinactinospora thermotolerans DSM 45154]